MKPCCEEAHELTLHLEAVSAEISRIRSNIDKLYERAKYYDESLSEHQLWEIAQEFKKLASLAET